MVLAAPDRPESRPFFHLAQQKGFAWRVLRRARRPDLPTPVFIYQLTFCGSGDAASGTKPAKRLKTHAAGDGATADGKVQVSLLRSILHHFEALDFDAL